MATSRRSEALLLALAQVIVREGWQGDPVTGTIGSERFAPENAKGRHLGGKARTLAREFGSSERPLAGWLTQRIGGRS